MVSTLFKPLGIVMILFTLAGVLSACENTIRGVGEDVEETGDAVGDAVQ